MRLRNTLIVYFISLIFIVVILFGWKAYYIAIDSMENTEKDMLHDITKFKADLLSREYSKTSSIPSLALDSNNKKSTSRHLFILINDQGNPVNMSALNNEPVFDTLLKAIKNSSQDNGHIHHGDEHILWVSEIISGSPYSLIHALKTRHGENDLFNELLNSIFITALIIIWIATWIALIISFRISNKIDRQTEALTYQKMHDNLTGLPNRITLYEQLERDISWANNNNEPITIMLMDLDAFKDINGTLGHSVGDKVLLEVVKRIKTITNNGETIARLGGDEFAIIIPGSSINQARELITRLTNALDNIFYIDSFNLSIRASIGIALYPDHGSDAETLIKCADIAMYKAKRYKSGDFLYSPESNKYSVRRLTIAGDLSDAILHNKLTLYYQPKMDLQTFRVNEVEALARWNHPQYGFISPEEFIGLAEDSGLIRSLTLWALNSAMEQCHLWEKDGIKLDIAVNLSPHNLQEPKLPEQIEELLNAWDLSPSSLILEITESAIMDDPEYAADILTRLDNMGVRCSVDDFGIGYSSLSMLSKLPVSEIKIDRSFVMDMLENEKHRIIVQSTIDLTHNLGRLATAEGIEDQETFELLRTLGCEKAQGYYMSRPLPAFELSRWLANHHNIENISTYHRSGTDHDLEVSGQQG